MKVWLLTKGEYSDYHEVGIFSSKENADKAVAFYGDKESWSSFNDPVEMEVDALIKDGRLQFFVGIGHNKTRVWKDYENEREINFIEEHQFIPEYTIYVMAENEEHAVKIASDLLAQYKALNPDRKLLW